MNKEGNHLLRLFSHCPKCGAKAFVEDTEKSKRCEACDFVYYMNPSAATVAIIIDDLDRLLTVRRSKEPAKGTLDLPGGFCDCYETGEEGVKREVLEETGLSVVEALRLKIHQSWRVSSAGTTDSFGLSCQRPLSHGTRSMYGTNQAQMQKTTGTRIRTSSTLP